MNKKTSVRAAVRDAKHADTKARQGYQGSALSAVATTDSFVNFAHKMGIGADNPLSSGSYGYNPISRNRNLLEWIHRGSWLGGQAIDVLADDMTRAGVDFATELKPEDSEKIETRATTLGIWNSLNSTIRWGRLYGGCIAVMLVDGQDLRTPLNLETIGPDQFKGLCVLDRWMIEPSLEDLVTDYGPDLGLPKFYRVMPNAPALRNQAVHYSRIALRHVGIELPYQQALTENLWGVSVLERLYDRMIAYDSASTGAAQLVYKAYLRTLKIKDLRQVVAAGGKAMEGLTKYGELMRRYQGIEGITMIDADDEFEVQHTSAFSGLDSALNQFGQQLSGALQIPLVRLFGQSPAGLNSSGESDLRNYYDSINQQQRKQMTTGTTAVYRMLAASEGIKLPEGFGIKFASLWQLSDTEKSDIAQTTGEAIGKAQEDGLIGRQTALKELRQSSKITGIFTNITEEMIEEADDEVLPPMAEEALGNEHDLELQGNEHKHALDTKKLDHKQQQVLADKKAKETKNAQAGRNGKAKPVGGGAKRRDLV